MQHIELAKIVNKKTKSTLLLDSYLTTNKNDNFKMLLAIGVLAGANINCIRQISKARLTQNVDFDKIRVLQNKFNSLCYDMITEIERTQKLDGINTNTHTFY